MQLTKIQRRFLVRYRSFRDNPPTAFRMLVLLAPRHIIVSLLLGLAVLASLDHDQRHIAFLAVGMWIGLMLNLLAQILAVPKVWPVLQQILDWEELDDLLESDHSE